MSNNKRSEVQVTSISNPTSMRAFKDRTNHLPSISTKTENKVQTLGPLQSRSNFRDNDENRYSLKGKDLKLKNNTACQRQMHKSSSSRSIPNTLEEEGDSNIIEENRTYSNGSRSVHKYEKGKLLGKGGFAKVYLCTSLDTQKKYAVKIVPKKNLMKSRARQKLQAEIKIHRTLKDKRICEFKHYFEDKKNCYILLELCPNQTLNELLKRRKRLTELEVMYYMDQIIQGVQYMHNCNVIHRDLKLGNLFLDRHMGIKIGDLGLAVKLISSGEKRTTICGTPNYIAPEVIDCLNGGERGHSFEVDVWAMGVIMYACLYGKPPYEAKDVKSTYKRILNNEYSFPSKIIVSPYAKDLISGMLQSDPTNRPSVEQVMNHEFFAGRCTRLPSSLSPKCIKIAPIWREDADGNFITTFPQIEVENSTILKQKEMQKADVVHGSRQPLSSLNANTHKEKKELLLKTKNLKKNIDNNDLMYQQRKAFERMDLFVNGNKNSQQSSNIKVKSNLCKITNPKFAIYSDENNGDPSKSQTQHHQLTETNEEVELTETTTTSKNPVQQKFWKDIEKKIVRNSSGMQSSNNSKTLQSETQPVQDADDEKAEAAHTSDDTAKKNNAAKQVLPQSVLVKKESIVEFSSTNVLETMHSRLEKSFNVKEERNNLEDNAVPHKMEHPSIWISRYVDYTSKYGLGFLLNDGSAGVYFNDSTKIILSQDGNIFQYIERRKASSSESSKVPNQELDPTVHIYSLTSYPSHLQKKVTLLQHFRNYLIEQQDTMSANEPQYDEMKTEAENSANSISPYVYLKKWVRTKHAILFRLSNSTVQVVFYDKTEVLLFSEARLVTYVDKTGERTTYPIQEITKNPNGDVGKRLKYAKDILQQLICGSK